MARGGITMIGRAELHICRGNVTTDSKSWSLFLCRATLVVGMHSSFQTTMQEPIVYVLSEITRSFSESRLSHGLRSPQPFSNWTFVGHPRETRLETAPQATCRTSTMSLMHSRRNGAGSPSKHWAAHWEHEASLSRLSGGEWRPHSLLRLL